MSDAVTSTSTSTDTPRRGALRVLAFLRCLELVGAAVLLGGTLALAAVAQIAFHSPHLLSYEQAGKFLAACFERSLTIEVIAVAAMAGATLGAIFLGAPRHLALVVALLCGAGPVAAHASFSGRMAAIRERHQGTITSLPEDHEDRKMFGRLHGYYGGASLALLGWSLGVLGAAAGAATAGGRAGRESAGGPS